MAEHNLDSSTHGDIHCFLRQLDHITGTLILGYGSGCVFHYTQTQVLASALSFDFGNDYQGPPGWNHLYATRTAYLNDSKEIEFGRERVEAFAERIPSGRVADVFRRILESTRHLDCYVACFSGVADQLEQWRSYGDNGVGVSVGFDPRELASNYTSGWVLYDRGDQDEFLLRILKQIEELVNAETSENMDIIELAGASLSELMLSCLALIKHEAFAFEKEFRILAVRSHERKTEADGLHFRLIRNKLVPYLKLSRRCNDGTEGAWSVRRVVAGPGFSDAEFEGLTEFVAGRTGGTAQVSASEIPYVPTR